jgi:hypothetical protein
MEHGGDEVIGVVPRHPAQYVLRPTFPWAGEAAEVTTYAAVADDDVEAGQSCSPGH